MIIHSLLDSSNTLLDIYCLPAKSFLFTLAEFLDVRMFDALQIERVYPPLLLLQGAFKLTSPHPRQLEFEESSADETQ